MGDASQEPARKYRGVASSSKDRSRVSSTFVGQVQCVFCPSKLSSWKQFLAHLLKEPGIQLFACHLCSQAFPTRDSLPNHQCTADEGSKRAKTPFVDKICYQYVFCSSCGMSVGLWHPNSEENYRRLLSSHSASNLRNLAVYAEQRIPVGKEGHDIIIPFTPEIGSISTGCQTCDVPYIQVFDLEAHSKEHAKEEPAGCSCCGAKVYSKTFSRVHSLFHVKTDSRIIDFSDSVPVNEVYAPPTSQEKPLYKDQLVFCDLCGKYCNAHTFNEVHDCATEYTRRYMVGSTLVKCPSVALDDVKFDFEDKGIPQLLLDSITDEFGTKAYLSLQVGDLIESTTDKISNDRSSYVCLECSLIISNLDQAERHHSIHHSTEDKHKTVAPLVDSSCGKFDFQCPLCPEILCSLEAVQRHIFLAHNKWLKKMDPIEVIASKPLEDSSLGTSSPAEKEAAVADSQDNSSWVCPACPHRNSSLDALKEHLKTSHIHICTGCAYCFLSEDFKRVHQQLCKSSLRTDALFFCYICRESFPTLPRYYVHLIQTHQDAVNFNDKTGQVLPICGALVSNDSTPSRVLINGQETIRAPVPVAAKKMNSTISPGITVTMNQSRPLMIRPVTGSFHGSGQTNNGPEVRLYPAPLPPRNRQKIFMPHSQDPRTVQYYCPVCEAAVFPYKQNLIKHIAHNHTIGTSCQLCSEVFTTKIMAAQHTVSTCTGIKLTKCTICFMDFKDEMKKDQHMTLFHQATSFSCGICGEKFNVESKYRQHRISHHQVKKKEEPSIFQGPAGDFCTECNIKFDTVRKYKLHMEFAHNISLSPQNGTSLPNKRPRSILVMGKSGVHGGQIVKIVSGGSLRNSSGTTDRPKLQSMAVKLDPEFSTLKTEEPEIMASPSPPPTLTKEPKNTEPPEEDEELMILSDEEGDGNLNTSTVVSTRPQTLPCSLCSEKFATNAGLKEHMKSHEFDVGETIQDTLPVPLDAKVYLCRLCSLVYQSREVFKRHMSKHGAHSSCIHCSSVCFTDVQLKTHSQAHEAGKLIYGCVQCHLAYKTELQLCRHILEQHGRPLLWFCKACGIASTNRQTISQHVTIEGICFPPSRDSSGFRMGATPHQKLHFQPEFPETYKAMLKKSENSLSVGECVHRSFLAYNEALLCCPLCGTLVPASKFMLENASLRKSGRLKLSLITSSGRSNVLLTTKTDDSESRGSRNEPQQPLSAPTKEKSPESGSEHGYTRRSDPSDFTQPESSQTSKKSAGSPSSEKLTSTQKDVSELEEPSSSDSTAVSEAEEDSTELPAKEDTFEDGKWTCGKCEEKFPSKAAMKVHHLKHDRKNRNFCLECGTPFKEEGTLESHLLSAHFKQKIKYQLSCRNCRTIFDSVKSFRMHFIGSIRCFGVFRAPECELLFQTEQLRDVHSANHLDGKKHCCCLCGKGFHSEAELVSHDLMEHAFNKWFMCRECGLCFGEESQLQTHYRCKHLVVKFDKHRQKLVVCTICQKRFPEKELDSHLLNLHEVIGYKGKSPVILTDVFRKFTT